MKGGMPSIVTGLCVNSLIDWNFYLTRLDGEVQYEGYKNSHIKKVGENWTSSNLFTSQEAFIEMNPADNNKKYPVGFFIGDVIEPNG